MAENTIKGSEPQKGNSSLFAFFERLLKLEKLFEEGLPVKYLPKVLFLVGVGLFYIANSHYADKTVRQINRLQVEVDELRVDHTTMKADMMKQSKQSEVAKKVKAMGLEESTDPPFKIKRNQKD